MNLKLKASFDSGSSIFESEINWYGYPSRETEFDYLAYTIEWFICNKGISKNSARPSLLEKGKGWGEENKRFFEMPVYEIKALKKETEEDWWDGLSKHQRDDIDAGLKDLKAGRKKTITEVFAKYK